MKVEGGGQMSLSDIEYFIRESQAETEILAQMKNALASGDNATYEKLGRQFFGLPEGKLQ